MCPAERGQCQGWVQLFAQPRLFRIPQAAEETLKRPLGLAHFEDKHVSKGDKRQKLSNHLK